MEKIGEVSPHTVCYPAIVNSGFLTISNRSTSINDEALFDFDNTFNFDKQSSNITAQKNDVHQVFDLMLIV